MGVTYNAQDSSSEQLSIQNIASATTESQCGGKPHAPVSVYAVLGISFFVQEDSKNKLYSQTLREFKCVLYNI